jgi:hypothetical protein
MKSAMRISILLVVVALVSMSPELRAEPRPVDDESLCFSGFGSVVSCTEEEFAFSIKRDHFNEVIRLERAREARQNAGPPAISPQASKPPKAPSNPPTMAIAVLLGTGYVFGDAKSENILNPQVGIRYEIRNLNFDFNISDENAGIGWQVGGGYHVPVEVRSGFRLVGAYGERKQFSWMTEPLKYVDAGIEGTIYQGYAGAGKVGAGFGAVWEHALNLPRSQDGMTYFANDSFRKGFRVYVKLSVDLKRHCNRKMSEC